MENRNEMIVKLSERPGETIKVIKTRNYSDTNNKKVKKNKSKKSQRKSANSPRKSRKSPKKNKKKRTKNYRRN